MSTSTSTSTSTGAGADVVLRAQGVEQRFGEVEVLRGVDLAVHRGEMVALTGASGSGKSSLLEILGGLERPTGGQVEIGGAALVGLSARRLARLRLERIGFVFQQIRLLPALTLLENIVLPGIVAGREPRAVVHARARATMEELEIGHLASRRLGEASGGQLQRAGICRALINRPRILLADEPTGALDAAATGSVLDALDRLRQDGMTIVMVTHEADVAARADRALPLVEGRLAPGEAL
ncbi:ABC transporter ATP-binding protein [Brachybacterium sp. DNPG3]